MLLHWAMTLLPSCKLVWITRYGPESWWDWEYSSAEGPHNPSMFSHHSDNSLSLYFYYSWETLFYQEVVNYGQNGSTRYLSSHLSDLFRAFLFKYVICNKQKIQWNDGIIHTLMHPKKWADSSSCVMVWWICMCLSNFLLFFHRHSKLPQYPEHLAITASTTCLGLEAPVE